jgi:hemerythrin-like domain-containing protein
MKRDARLHGLTSDHHHALVLARSLLEHTHAWTQDSAIEIRRRFVSELEPHFRVEEDLLLPALRRTRAAALVERTVEDHAFLRSRVEAAGSGDGRAAHAFAERLRGHIRFEERELFQACEELLPDDVLDEVARRAPHKR